MNQFPSKIKLIILWILTIGSFLLMLIGAFAKVKGWPTSQATLSVALIFFCSHWLLILTDIINRKIYHKKLWLLSMLILPYLAGLAYILQRKKLTKPVQRFS